VVENQAGGGAEDSTPAGAGRGIPTPLVQASTSPGGASVPGDDDEDAGDMASFHDAEVGAVVTTGNSAEARVLEAFPGAEEIL
jgi:hypothetical protein